MKELKKLIISLKKIKLIDRCLIIFMFILMAQSIYGLFTGDANSQYASSIDAVVRTTSAAIFGYFLSANFIKRTNSQDHTDDTNDISSEVFTQDMTTPETTIKNQIGFVAESSIPQESTIGNITSQDNPLQPQNTTSNQQIIITTIIGVVALIAILTARNFMPLTASSIAAMSQLRDFVSGCVGFLVGCPVEEHSK